MNIVVIPARSQSKRIKNKNIKTFYGKQIITYPINIILRSKLFDEIIVSTDSKKISKIVQNLGAKVPFIRNEYLSGDNIPTRDVVLDVINYLIKKKINLNFVCCIYPTNPFLDKKDLVKAFKILDKKNYVFSAIKYTYPIERSFTFKNKKIYFKNKKNIFKRTQDFETHYHDAGHFYIAHYKTWLNKKNVFSSDSKFIEIKRDNYCEIDNLDDWNFAKKIYSITKRSY